MTFALLTTDDLRRAQECAERMVAHNVKTDYSHRALVPTNDPLANMAVGLAGEITFAAWLGVHWRCKVGDYRVSDVAGYHVRTRRDRDQTLIVQPAVYPNGRHGDPDDAVMVLVVRHSTYSYEIVGWLIAADGRRLGEWKDPGNIGKPAHFVARKHMHPLSDLPETPEVKDARSHA